MVSISHTVSRLVRLTLDEVRDETVSSTVHKTALPRHTDGCQNIITRYHHRTNVGCKQFLQDTGSGGLKLVFEHDETDEVKIIFDIRSTHLLSLDPAQLLQMSGGTPNDSVSFMGIE